MDAEEHLARESEWTVCDSDGVDHRAIRQGADNIVWVITACDWWLTHNVSGEKAPVRVDRVPTCVACMLADMAKVARAT